MAERAYVRMEMDGTPTEVEVAPLPGNLSATPETLRRNKHLERLVHASLDKIAKDAGISKEELEDLTVKFLSRSIRAVE